MEMCEFWVGLADCGVVDYQTDCVQTMYANKVVLVKISMEGIDSQASNSDNIWPGHHTRTSVTQKDQKSDIYSIQIKHIYTILHFNFKNKILLEPISNNQSKSKQLLRGKIQIKQVDCKYFGYKQIKIMKKLMQEQNRLWDYQVLKQLGKGQYGHVYQVKLKKDGKIYALKKINIAGSHQKQKIQAFRQIKALKLISHPNIIQYFDSFLSMDNIYIVTAFAEKGDLSLEIQNRIKREKKFKEDQLWLIFQALVSALKILHEKYIIHRDIKVENIFQTGKGEYKVGDLGMSKIIYDNTDLLTTRVGTPIYFAPEIIQHKLYSFPVDIWALGCVFYYMAALEHPFKDATIQTLAYYIIEKQPKPIKGPYSPQLIAFIVSMFDKNPQTRPTIHDLYKKLKERKEQKIYNKVSIFNLKQILTLKAQHFQELSNDKKSEKMEQSQVQAQPKLIMRQYHKKLNQSMNGSQNPQGINKNALQKRNMSLVLPKTKKQIQSSNEKQYPECFSPTIKSNGFSLHMNSPQKGPSPRIRMGHTVRYNPPNLNNFSLSLHESPIKNIQLESPRKIRRAPLI